MVNHACKLIVASKLEKSRVTVFQVYLNIILVDIRLFGASVPLDSFFFFFCISFLFSASLKLIFKKINPLNSENDQHLFSPKMSTHKQEKRL